MGFDYLFNISITACKVMFLLAVRAFGKLLHAFELVDDFISRVLGRRVSIRNCLIRIPVFAIDWPLLWSVFVPRTSVSTVSECFSAWPDIFLKDTQVLEALWGTVANLSPRG